MTERAFVYHMWPACAGCAEEVPVAILIAGRVSSQVTDSVCSAWPFLALAILDNRRAHAESQMYQRALTYLGHPSLPSLEILEHNFNVPEDSEDPCQHSLSASVLFSRSRELTKLFAKQALVLNKQLFPVLNFLF